MIDYNNNETFLFYCMTETYGYKRPSLNYNILKEYPIIINNYCGAHRRYPGIKFNHVCFYKIYKDDNSRSPLWIRSFKDINGKYEFNLRFKTLEDALFFAINYEESW